MGFERLPAGALNNYQLLEKEIPIKKEGFLYIYVANESPYDQDVWFDDFTVEVTKSPVAAVSDYYPFGMLQAGNSTNSSDPLGNKYLYNGNELQKELDLNIYDFNSRFYNQSLGRFQSIDKLADSPKQFNLSGYQFSWNNPILLQDSDGEYPGNGGNARGGTRTRVNINHQNSFYHTNTSFRQRQRVNSQSRTSRTRERSSIFTPGRVQTSTHRKETTYNTSRGNGKPNSNESPAVRLGYDDNSHTFGNMWGNGLKLANDIAQTVKTIMGNAQNIKKVEHFTQVGLGEKLVGTSIFVDNAGTTLALDDLQNEYMEIVAEVARGDLSVEEFLELDTSTQNMRMGLAMLKVGQVASSPKDIIYSYIDEDNKVEKKVYHYERIY